MVKYLSASERGKRNLELQSRMLGIDGIRFHEQRNFSYQRKE